MDTSYKTDWWDGREVMPGESMRFVQHNNLPKPLRGQGLGGDIAPLFDRDKSGKIVTPKPHRPTPESYTIGSYISGGDRRAEGKLRDALIKTTNKRAARSSVRARS